VPASSFDRVRFILVEPSHPGNIGAAARAIRTMGFRRLVVVAPKHPDFREQPEAIALATGAAGVLAAAGSCATLVEALAGVSTAFAMTGYDRQFGPALADLRACALNAAETLDLQQRRIAFVFGTSAGLSNEDIERCQVCCAIPADPTFSSLNLAQSVQVAAYECQLALRATPGVQAGQYRFGPDELAAPVDALESAYTHLEQALTAIGYLDPAEPKRLMPRLRRLFNRARPTPTELDLLRGIAAAIIASRSEARRAQEESGLKRRGKDAATIV
jgi:tRNA/rRNA methyltransferase